MTIHLYFLYEHVLHVSKQNWGVVLCWHLAHQIVSQVDEKRFGNAPSQSHEHAYDAREIPLFPSVKRCLKTVVQKMKQTLKNRLVIFINQILALITKALLYFELSDQKSADLRFFLDVGIFPVIEKINWIQV